jgi:hypothetical protein
MFKSKLQRLGKTDSAIFFDNKAVNYDFNVVRHGLTQFRRLFEIDKLPIHSNAKKPGFDNFLKEFTMVAVLLPNHRSKQHQPGVHRQLQERFDNLRRRRLLNRSAAVEAMNKSAPGIEQAEKIVNFGERADGASGIDGATTLVDGDGRLQAGDAIHVRSVELPQELPGVQGKRLDVLPLSFGENGIEGK